MTDDHGIPLIGFRLQDLQKLAADIHVSADAVAHVLGAVEDFLGKLSLGVPASVMVEPSPDFPESRQLRLCYAKHDGKRWGLYLCEPGACSPDRTARSAPRWARILAVRALRSLLGNLFDGSSTLRNQLTQAHSLARRAASSLRRALPRLADEERPHLTIENRHITPCGEFPVWATDRPEGAYFGYYEGGIAGDQWVLVATKDEVKVAGGDVDWMTFTLKLETDDWNFILQKREFEWPDLMGRLADEEKVWLLACLWAASVRFGRATAELAPKKQPRNGGK